MLHGMLLYSRIHGNVCLKKQNNKDLSLTRCLVPRVIIIHLFFMEDLRKAIHWRGLINASQRCLACGPFNRLLRGLLEDLCVREDFGGAGCLPGAGANGSLRAVGGLWNTDDGDGEHVLAAAVRGVGRKSLPPPLRLSW